MKITDRIPNGKGTDKLSSDEYYALMVTDYLDYDKSWLGLERTSNGRIYIAKNYTKRKDRYRGVVIIVEVSKDDKTCILGN